MDGRGWNGSGHRLEGCAQALADLGVEEMRDLPEVTRDDLVKMMRERRLPLPHQPLATR